MVKMSLLNFSATVHCNGMI